MTKEGDVASPSFPNDSIAVAGGAERENQTGRLAALPVTTRLTGASLFFMRALFAFACTSLYSISPLGFVRALLSVVLSSFRDRRVIDVVETTHDRRDKRSRRFSPFLVGGEGEKANLG